jgi:hypothetical protein
MSDIYKIRITGITRRQDSSVGIVTCYKLDGQGSISSRSKQFFSSLQQQDPFWDPPSLIHNEYQGLFHGGKVAIA